MDEWLSQSGQGDLLDVAAGPAGIANVGIALFLVLGIYAVLLLNGDRLPSWLRLPSPAGLRPRLTIALVLVATLPAISLALVLSDRASSQRAHLAFASLQAEADEAGRSLGHLLARSPTRAAPVDPASMSAVQDVLGKKPVGGLLITDKDRRVVLQRPAVAGGSEPDAVRNAVLGVTWRGGKPMAFVVRSADGVEQDYVGAAATTGDGWQIVRYAPLSALQSAWLQEYGVALGWLLAALIVSFCLAVALAGSISGPLSALDAAVRRFDPELDREPPTPPANAPREVIVVFEHLSAVARRLRHSYGQLRESLRQGERLRSELIQVIENHAQEIKGRTAELKEANEALDRLNRIDPTTGVANRRGFREFLDRAWRTALRDQQPLSILVIDIDHFNAYNDSYGHEQGDTCIKAVADALCHVVCRASDMVARYGGEEFVAVLGNTPLEGALQVGEQIRAVVQALAIPHRGAPDEPVVTVSVGVTSTLPARGTKSDTCLAAADRALDAAKEQGRNRVGYSTAARTGLFQSLCLPNDPAPKAS